MRNNLSADKKAQSIGGLARASHHRKRMSASQPQSWTLKGASPATVVICTLNYNMIRNQDTYEKADLGFSAVWGKASRRLDSDGLESSKHQFSGND